MAGFYDRMRATGKRLIDKFNQEGTDRVAEVITPNPDPRYPPTIDRTPTPVPAVVFGVTANMITADPNIVMGDVYSYVSPVDYSPDVGDQININSRAWRIMTVKPIPAAGEPCVYRFTARGSE